MLVFDERKTVKHCLCSLERPDRNIPVGARFVDLRGVQCCRVARQEIDSTAGYGFPLVLESGRVKIYLDFILLWNAFNLHFFACVFAGNLPIDHRAGFAVVQIGMSSDAHFGAVRHAQMPDVQGSFNKKSFVCRVCVSERFFKFGVNRRADFGQPGRRLSSLVAEKSLGKTAQTIRTEFACSDFALF